jgi:hypothetical protein
MSMDVLGVSYIFVPSRFYAMFVAGRSMEFYQFNGYNT